MSPGLQSNGGPFFQKIDQETQTDDLNQDIASNDPGKSVFVTGLDYMVKEATDPTTTTATTTALRKKSSVALSRTKD